MERAKELVSKFLETHTGFEDEREHDAWRYEQGVIAGARAVLEEARRKAINGSVPPTRSVVRVVPLSDLESLFTDTEEK